MQSARCNIACKCSRCKVYGAKIAFKCARVSACKSTRNAAQHSAAQCSAAQRNAMQRKFNT
eukprot:318042-Lingulodinium_polyedra.AAC.1